ncbi:extracellular solute-binding protein [bacterium]|nr:MAG: extracellular solute-binding protein [bacterium]
MGTPTVSRRQFMSGSAKVGAAIAVGSASLAAFLEACQSGSGGGAEASTIAVEVDEGQNANPFTWLNATMGSKFSVQTKTVGLPFVGQYEKIVSEMITRSNVYDVLVFPPQMLGDFAAKGFLAPLGDLLNESDLKLDDILPAYREPGMKRNGKLYAAPYDGDLLQVAYRKDLFDKAGIKQAPATWDDFLGIARELHNPPTQFGNAFYGQRGFCYAWFINIFAANGGQWFDADMKPGIAGDAGVKALEMMLELKRYSPPNILQIGYPELNEVYLGGSTAMVVQWDDLALKAEDATKSKVVGMNAYAACPVRSYMPYSRVMAVSAFSQNPHNSAKVIQYMNSSEAQVQFDYDPNCGEDPCRLSVLDPALVKDHTGKPTMPAAQATSYVNAIKDGLKAGYPELSITGGPRYLDILDLKINEALAGNSSPADALKACAGEWDSITTSLGKDNQVKAYADWIQAFHTAGVQY